MINLNTIKISQIIAMLKAPVEESLIMPDVQNSIIQQEIKRSQEK